MARKSRGPREGLGLEDLLSVLPDHTGKALPRSSKAAEFDVEDLMSRLEDHPEKAQQFWDLIIPFMSTIDPEDERHVACGLGCQMKITPPSKAAAPACLSNCAICASQYLSLNKQRLPGFSYAATISDVEAQSKIDTMIATTRDNLEYAMQQIHVFGDAILKRWEKRKRQQRVSVLITAMPTIFTQKWLQINLPNEMSRRNDFYHDLGRYRSKWLLQWLDLPTFSEDSSRLLTVMHHRSHADPTDWVPFDGQELKKAMSNGNLDATYNPHCVSMVRESFGKLVPWSADAVHRGDIIGYPLAELIFDSQKILSEVLRSTVDLLLGPNRKDIKTGNATWYESAKSAFRKPQIVQQFAFAHPAFSAPPKFDHKHVVNLLLSRARIAEDELWQLQTDPAFVRRTLECVQHSGHHASLPGPQKRRQLIAAMISVLPRCTSFGLASEQARWLEDVYDSDGKNIVVGKNLPVQYEYTLQVLEQSLRKHFAAQKNHMWHLCTLMPTFQHHFSFKQAKDEKRSWTVKTKTNDAWKEDPLFWAIMQIGEHDKVYGCDPSFHFAMIENLVGSAMPQSGAPSRMTQTLYDHLSDMAAVHEALAAIHYHRPAPRFRRKNGDLGDGSLLGGDPEPWSDSHFMDLAMHFLLGADSHLWPPLDDFLSAEPPSLDDPAELAVTKLKKSYSALGVFWEHVGVLGIRVRREVDFFPWEDITMQRFIARISVHTRDGFDEEVVTDECEALRQAIAARESAKRLRPTQKQGVSSTNSTHAGSISDQCHEVQTVWGTIADDPIELPAAKVKIKSRPSYAQTPKDSLVDLDITNANKIGGQHDPIPVSQLSERIFSRMFTAYPMSGGPVKWVNFVAAMVDAGFSGTHSGGSAVTFKDERRGGGSIVFHRPHPESIIDDVMLRGMGKRLSKWFGFDKDSFAVRQD